MREAGLHLEPSTGADVLNTPDFATTENDLHKVVVYWRNGEAETNLPPKSPEAIRFACISDTHNKTEQFQSAALRNLNISDDIDVLLHAGDFTGTGTHAQTQAFCNWLKEYGKRAIVIAGNHDVTFDAEYYNARGAERFHGGKKEIGDPRDFFPSNVTYLEDSSTSVAGLCIYGAPWQPEFHDWAFNLPRGPSLAEKWDQIDENVEILITHGPPHGKLGGICKGGFDSGCKELRKKIRQLKPLVQLHGTAFKSLTDFDSYHSLLK